MAPNFSNPGSAVVQPIRLAHVVLQTQVDNYAAMVAFYKTFLSATASFENETISFLTYDDEHHRIAIAALPNTGPKAPASAGLRHIAFTFATLADLALAYRQRKEAHGMLPYWCVNHGPTTSMYYRDPDGNELETQVDNFDTAEEASEYMMSEAFLKNPVGADYDPEELVRRLEAGEDESEIKKPVDVGPRTLAGIL